VVTKGSKEAHDLKAGVSLSWLYLASGITAALTILGAFAIIFAQGELASGKRTITITGEAVCLPHKKAWFGLFGGAETEECRIGFLSDGSYYGLNFPDNESSDLFVSAQGSEKLFNLSGSITIPPQAFTSGDFDRYDIVGVIDVISASAM
jgi:hypothetical protein